MKVSDWIEQNYDKILQWSKQICLNHDAHIDLAHDIIIAFQEHEKAQELVDRGEARWFVTRMLLNQGRSTSSPFYRNYRVYHEEATYENYPQLFEREDDPYNLEIDLDIEAIQGVIEEITVESNEGFYCMTIVQLLMQQERINFSELERDTNIPRTSISQAYYTGIEMIKERLKKNGHIH